MGAAPVGGLPLSRFSSAQTRRLLIGDQEWSAAPPPDEGLPRTRSSRTPGSARLPRRRLDRADRRRRASAPPRRQSPVADRSDERTGDRRRGAPACATAERCRLAQSRSDQASGDRKPVPRLANPGGPDHRRAKTWSAVNAALRSSGGGGSVPEQSWRRRTRAGLPSQTASSLERRRETLGIVATRGCAVRRGSTERDGRVEPESGCVAGAAA